MKKLRVLIAEDSLTVRRRLVEIVASDPEIELVGEASDGKQAIEICRMSRPDIITMDMMMPMMSGLAATEYIMAHCPTPILMVSASTNRGELFKIYEALAAGAVDVLEKPLDSEPDEVWARRFLATLKIVSRIRVITHPRARLSSLQRPELQMPLPQQTLLRSGPPCEVVAMGASTGGPGALVDVLRGLPAEFSLPVLIVLHMNEPFAAAFAEWLDGQTQRKVINPTDGMRVADGAGRVMLAPGGCHLIVRDGRLRLTLGPERHSCRPSVDVLFESVAAEYGAAAAACLLTGMGKDGALGLLKIREAGGTTIAQDERTSVVYGMPREAVKLGAAQMVFGIEEIGPRLAALQSRTMETCP
jgi:two-component system, chemotaxis family, protein-glutamate methylesterase/glutaminase